MVLVLLAYIALSSRKINNGLTYQILNLLAGVFMAIGLYPKNAWFSFTLQVIWSLVALKAIIDIKKNENSHTKKEEISKKHRKEQKES